MTDQSWEPPTYSSPLKSLPGGRLESSPTGSSTPPTPSPFPWLWFRWTEDRDRGNLVHPFMRITKRVPPFIGASRNFFTSTFRALGRNHTASTPTAGLPNPLGFLESSSFSVMCQRLHPFLSPNVSSHSACSKGFPYSSALRHQAHSGRWKVTLTGFP